MSLKLIFAIFFATVLAEVPSIPTYPMGFWIKSSFTRAPKLVIDAFWDPLCPDTLDSKNEIEKMGKLIDDDKYDWELNIHLMALPYHKNSFMILQGAHYIWDFYNTKGDYNDAINIVYSYMNLTLVNWVELGTAATMNMTGNECKEYIYKITNLTKSDPTFSHDDFINALTYGNKYDT